MNSDTENILKISKTCAKFPVLSPSNISDQSMKKYDPKMWWSLILQARILANILESSSHLYARPISLTRAELP